MDTDIEKHRMSPVYLKENELWHLSDSELEVFKKEYKKYRASVKTVKKFSRKGKQLNIKF